MLDEATAFLTAVEDLSRTRQLDFEVAYGDEIIGYIKHGAMDEGLSEAFLDEWRRGLGVI
jgi:hypothetical protein